MKEYHSLSHTRWDCKYHVVFIPKRRKKKMFGALRKHLGEILHELAAHKESRIVEGHLMADHVHLCICIPPKYVVSRVVGYIKGKSAIQIARQFGGRHRNFTGENFWARGFFVSTVGVTHRWNPDRQTEHAGLRHAGTPQGTGSRASSRRL
ncbi:MAG: IS200/IS605 family transposase [Candidatus Competibacteraceae bacterium]